MANEFFQKGQAVRAINVKPLPGNTIAPPLEENKEYPVNDYCLDQDGNQHLDVGLVSKYEYIRSYETKEHLPNGNKIHWCHPSRFELAK